MGSYTHLRDLAFDNDLTDNSHLNKLFKKYSNLSPSAFKDNISYFDNLILRI